MSMSLPHGWSRALECCGVLRSLVPSGPESVLNIEREYPLPEGMRAYNMARKDLGLCLTTHMGDKHFLFLDEQGTFTIGPRYLDEDVSMICRGRAGSLVVAPVNMMELSSYSGEGELMRTVDLKPHCQGGFYKVWRHCSTGALEIVVLKSETDLQKVVSVDFRSGLVRPVKGSEILVGATNRVRYHAGCLYFLQNNGPHILVAGFDDETCAMRVQGIQALSGARPMGFDVSASGITVGWTDRMVKYDFQFVPQVSAGLSGYESVDLLQVEGAAFTYWMRNQDFKSIYLVTLGNSGT